MTAPATAPPLDPSLFTWPPGPDGAFALLGSRCRACDAVAFPARATCGRCQSPDLAVEELPRTGTVWTWTAQRFLPKAPYTGPETMEDFAGFVLGYVDLPGACVVQARLDVQVDEAAERVAIGTEVELVAVPFTSRGTETVTYAFRPVDPTAEVTA